MLDNLDLNGSSWAGLLICPGNVSFAVTVYFTSMNSEEYSGSFQATGPQSVQGSFTATRTGDTVTFRGTTGKSEWAQLTCSAGLAAVDQGGRFALGGLVMAAHGKAASGVLALFTVSIKPYQIPAWDSLQSE
jgi:hypothetical protein